MRNFLIITAFVLLLFSESSLAKIDSLRETFANNLGVVYTINIRNFAAQDKDNDEIINTDKGDIKGTFLNAQEKIPYLAKANINTIYLLPITKTGKLKAIGTAGSLYAMDSFNELNPQLDDTTNNLTIDEEAKKFIETAHKYNLKVIVDLPSCGSYDLSLKKPDWFAKNKKGEAIIPADWTDIRLFKIYNSNKTLYKPTYENFVSFIDKMQSLGFDGIRADVAAIKPYSFWKKLITHAREKNPDFLFIAEANPDWSNPVVGHNQSYATIDDLLNSGFDCYYGSWSDFKNIKTKKDFDERIEKNIKILKKHPNSSLLATFATHDQQAPILKGENYWNMILWLTTTLPNNSYFLDGFFTGDDFTYKYENQKTNTSLTDDDYYYVHSGLMDIFNLTRSAKETYPHFKKHCINAINFKLQNHELFKKENYKSLKTGNKKVFAYTMKTNDKELVVVGSLDENEIQKAVVAPKILGQTYLFSVIQTKNKPKIENSKLNLTLEPYEIQVYLLKK